MKILVLYGSRYGCTEDCAKYLQNRINAAGHESIISDIKNLQAVSKEGKTSEADLACFDWVIIGGSIYVGKIRKEVKCFCEQNLQELLAKKIALFICCTTPEEVNDYFKNNFPLQLLAHAFKTVNFGGELRQNKMGFFDKKLTALIFKLEPKKIEVFYKNIDQLADQINAFSDTPLGIVN